MAERTLTVRRIKWALGCLRCLSLSLGLHPFRWNVANATKYETFVGVNLGPLSLTFAWPCDMEAKRAALMEEAEERLAARERVEKGLREWPGVADYRDGRFTLH